MAMGAAGVAGVADEVAAAIAVGGEDTCDPNAGVTTLAELTKGCGPCGAEMKRRTWRVDVAMFFGDVDAANGKPLGGAPAARSEPNCGTTAR